MDKIGEGGEAEVFALDDHRVLRRFRAPDHPAVAARLALTREVRARGSHLDVALPEVLDTFVDADGLPCFVERRLPGRSLTELLGEVRGARRRTLLRSYLDTATTIRTIDVVRPWFGELASESPLHAESWSAYLVAALDRQWSRTDAGQYPEVPEPAATVAAIRDRAGDRPDPEPALVHFDYFPGNVLAEGDAVTAVIDWSLFAIVGDADLDVVLAVSYLGVTPTATDADHRFAREWLADRVDTATSAFYERWAAAWWSPMHDDETLRRWSASILARP